MARGLRSARAFQLRRVFRPGPAQRPGRLPQPRRPPGGPARPQPLRAMLMTPWLAAGVGVVLAAALALHGPHAELTYTPVNPNGPCAPDGCGVSVPGQGTGGTAMSGSAPTEARPGTRLEHGRKALPTVGPAPHRGGSAPVRPPLEVRYRTVQSRPSGFTGLITMTGRAVQSGWQLTFQYPGATVESVAGLPWTVHGAEVTVTSGPSPSPAPGHAAGRVRIRIRASGTPSRPTRCTFNGVACSIH
jgi:Cellulose binding domain